MATLPLALQAAEQPARIFLAVSVVFFTLSIVWVARESWRRSSILPWLALLGGGIASLEEAWINQTIQLWYPVNSPFVMFTVLGTPQPLYVHLVYPGFVGLGAYLTYRGLQRFPDGRLLWPIFLGIVAMDMAFELSATAAGVFYYYGPQPFQAFTHGWPLWVAPINAAGPILGGWLMMKLDAHWHGRRRVLMALLPPAAYAGVYGAAGWPTVSLMNSEASIAFVWGGAVLSMGACVLLVSVLRLSLDKTDLRVSRHSSVAAAEEIQRQ